MSELDRIGRIGKAYWNRLKDSIDGDSLSAAEMELDEAIRNPIQTTQGASVSQPKPKDVDPKAWAVSRLGLDANPTSAEVKKRYQSLDRKAKKLIAALNERMLEKPEEADLDRLTLNQAIKLRDELGRAYAILSESDAGVAKRFNALELDESDNVSDKPASKSRTSTGAGSKSAKSGAPKAKSTPPSPPQQKPSNEKNGGAKSGAAKRFRSLELD